MIITITIIIMMMMIKHIIMTSLLLYIMFSYYRLADAPGPSERTDSIALEERRGVSEVACLLRASWRPVRPTASNMVCRGPGRRIHTSTQVVGRSWVCW